MTATRAAELISKALQGADWLSSVGVGLHEGKEAIFLYVTRKPPKDLETITRDAPVVIRHIGAIRPA